MSILKVGRNRKDGTRPYTLWVSVRNRGERIRLRSPEQTLEGARRYERMLRRTLAEHGTLDVLHTPSPTPEATFGELIERWTNDKVANVRKVSGRRTKICILRVHLLPHFGGVKLSDIDEGRVDSFVASLKRRGLHQKTVNNILTVLRTALTDGVRWKMLDRVPAFRLERAERADPRFLLEDEARRLVDAAPPGMWRAMVLMAITTGLRFNELLALEWSDVRIDQRSARIARGEVLGEVGTPKSGKPRTVPLNDETAAAINALPRSTARVFPMPPTLASPYFYALRELRRMCRVAGINAPVGWHTLRHTYATLSILARVPLNVVKKVMGHASIATTDHYVDMADSLLHEGSAAFPSLVERQPADSISANDTMDSSDEESENPVPTLA